MTRRPPHTPETKAKIKAGNTGKVVSQETKDKISKTLTGRIRTPEERKAIADGRRGKVKHSAETKAKISAAAKARHANPDNV